MVDEVTAYKSDDGTLWHNEEAAVKHDICKELQELLSGSQHVNYSERYAFAEEIINGYPIEWYGVLKIWWDYKERKRLAQVAAYDKAVAEATLEPKDAPEFPLGISPHAPQNRVVGGIPTDDEVPF